MEVTGAFGNIPLVEQESKLFGDTAVSADKLQLDFLKLLVAQLQFQDPLEPTTNTEFTSQMAQFSSLDAQQRSNTLLEQLLSSQGTNQMNQAVSYIGKQVVVDGNHTEVRNDTATVRFQMPEAGPVTIQLFNQHGELVKEVGPAFFQAGEGRAVINGASSDGLALQDGTYTFTVHREDGDGNQVAVSTLEAGQVTGVINGDSGVSLDLGGRLMPLDSVRRIEQGIT